MKINNLQQLKHFRGRRVLVRVDFNLPLNRQGRPELKSDTRIRMALPTLQWLLKKKARLCIGLHLGRPDGRPRAELSTRILVPRLTRLLKKKVVFQTIEEYVKKPAAAPVILLENLRFYPGEEDNDTAFARDIATHCDVYVNEAFACSHRKHASVHAITRQLPSYAGFLLQSEVKNLSGALVHPRRPLTVIFGGSKISSKLGLVKKFLRLADHVVLGGALANTVLKAQGLKIGKSLHEPTMHKLVKKFSQHQDLYTPVDVVTAKNIGGRAILKSVLNVAPDDIILDVGPRTLDMYSEILERSKTVIWNGPMGMTEYPQYATGTKLLAHEVKQLKDVQILIGGGETVAFLEKDLKIKNSDIFISSGGGAMLEFLERGSLPGLKPLLS